MTNAADPYAWMRRSADPRFIRHLEEENRRFERAMRPALPLAEEIFEEIAGRLPRTDATVPYRFGDHEYSFRYDEDREYPCLLRRRIGSGGAPELLLDYGQLLDGSDYLDVQPCVNRQSTMLAYGVDRRGDRIYSIRVRHLASGRDMAGSIPNATGNMAWSPDGKALFFSEIDPETLRWRRIKRWTPGTDAGAEGAATVYEEADDAFSCFVYTAKSNSFILIRATSGTSDEVRYIPAETPQAAPRLLRRRRSGLEYDVQHDGASFVVRTNSGHYDFRLMRASPEKGAAARWRPLLDPRDGAFLEDFELLRGWIALKERTAGGPSGRLVHLDGGVEWQVGSNDPLRAVEFKDNVELDATNFRFEESSFVDLTVTCDLDVTTGTTTVLKTERIEGGFDPDRYRAERHWVESADGTRIPLTLLVRNDLFSAPGPVLLYGYGSYGFSIDPYPWVPRFSLLDRGFAFAIAHVRGGGELGRAWHDAGRGRAKPNSVADFIACADYLLARGISAPGALFAMGESAGGFLVGAAINARPELFRAIAVIAPFVDILNSLSDPSAPLTTTDYGEWGDPGDPEDRAALLRYSPYDNIRPQAYPDILALTRLYDTQVGPWEPAKWLARIRELSAGGGLHLLKAELDSGHLGRSGRFAQYWDIALIYAFFLAVRDGTVDSKGGRPA